MGAPPEVSLAFAERLDRRVRSSGALDLVILVAAAIPAAVASAPGTSCAVVVV